MKLEIKCPWCWGEYIHHDRVTVFSREEDTMPRRNRG